MNNYQKFIEIIENGKDRMLESYNAIKNVVNKNEALDATDKFSEAVSKEVGFEFKAKDYGIKKIHGIVNKNNNKSESIIYEINNYVENTIMNEIIKSRSELDMNPLVARFIYDYHFNGGDIKYEECEYDGLVYLINKDMDEQFIIDYTLKIMNIAETRDLKDIIKYHLDEIEKGKDFTDEDDDYDEDYDDEDQ